jgi:hypothetical protein
VAGPYILNANLIVAAGVGVVGDAAQMPEIQLHESGQVYVVYEGDLEGLVMRRTEGNYRVLFRSPWSCS